MVFLDLLIMVGLMTATVVAFTLVVTLLRGAFPNHDDEWDIDLHSATEASAERTTRKADLGDDVERRASRIRTYAGENLARLTDEAVTADEVRRMRDEHLPELLRAYARIPPMHRDDAIANGEVTATNRLNGALDDMISRLDEIEAAISRGSINAFEDASRFVEARYKAERQQI